MHTLSNRIFSTLHGILRTLLYFLPGSRTDWRPGMLEEGWVIANHKLVSFHARFRPRYGVFPMWRDIAPTRSISRSTRWRRR